jgi:TPP-dependent pyruvate/acetoin dehydrogenase alpha subunit
VAEAEAVEAEAKAAVAEGIEFARQSPAPGIGDVTKFVHAEVAA